MKQRLSALPDSIDVARGLAARTFRENGGTLMQNRYKVCFISRVAYGYPLSIPVDKKFRRMKELGEMHVIGRSTDVKLRIFHQHGNFYLLPNLPFFLLRNALLYLMIPVVALWCIWRHNAQILVLSSPVEFTGAWTKGIARVLGRRVTLVVESATDFENSMFLERSVPFPSLSRWLLPRVVRYTLSQADILRHRSRYGAQKLQDWAQGQPTFYFPAWTDIEAFFEASSLPVEDGHPKILFAGRVSPIKGIHHLVSAFSRVSSVFPGAQLLIVGEEVNQRYADDLKRQVTQHGMNGRVRFIGRVDQNQLAHYMRQSWALVLPSISEALGRVVFEAMATGTLVIGSDVGGIPEIITDQVTGFLVPPGDEDALADHLQWVLNHPQETTKMGERAHEAAREIFSADAYVQNYTRLFEVAQHVLEQN